MDLSKESKATQDLYGLSDKDTNEFGQQCLLARRLVEAGVRFVQITSVDWDHHAGIKKGLQSKCKSVDKPIAGLLTDLKARGLLEDTLILWSGEFGRTPYRELYPKVKQVDGMEGREHNPYGFTCFIAGAGVKGGMQYGATDEFGYRAVEGKADIHDLHSTMLHILGLDHERLTYRFSGRDFRLTDVYGTVIKPILSVCMSSVSFSGACLDSSSQDNTLKLWNMETDMLCVRRLEKHHWRQYLEQHYRTGPPTGETRLGPMFGMNSFRTTAVVISGIRVHYARRGHEMLVERRSRSMKNHTPILKVTTRQPK